METPWDVGTKVCSYDPGYMTKMAAMPIYGKNLGTWYVALGVLGLPSSFK